jgi:TolB-like protein
MSIGRRFTQLQHHAMSGDPDQDFLNVSLTDAIITELARLNPRRLGVIARTSSMAPIGSTFVAHRAGA